MLQKNASLQTLAFTILFGALIFGCSKPPLSIEGSLKMSFTNTGEKEMTERPVLLLSDSAAAKGLEQWRNGYKAELDRISAIETARKKIIDSLEQAFKKSGDKKIETAIVAHNDSLRQFYAESVKFKKEFLTALVQQVVKASIAKSVTDNQGKFKFDNLKSGKYILMTLYTAPRQVGFIRQTLELASASVKTELSNTDIDPILNMVIEEGKEGK